MKRVGLAGKQAERRAADDAEAGDPDAQLINHFWARKCREGLAASGSVAGASA